MRVAHRPRRGREIPSEFLRFGVEFADGRRATNIGGCFARRSAQAEPPEGPVLLEHGGSGGGTHWDQTYWVWPLPPPGRVTFACEWPVQRVPLTRIDIDAAAIVDASKRAVTLWEAASGASGGCGQGYARLAQRGPETRET